MIAFDTETRGLNWFEPDERAFLGTWADTRGEYHEPLERSRGTESPEDVPGQRFLGALTGAGELVAHNLSFDVHQVRATTGLDILDLAHMELHDTDLMSRVLFPEGQRKDRGGHGLKNLAATFLKADAKAEEDAIKEMGRQLGMRSIERKGAYYEIWRAFPEVMEEYARADARYTYDLAQEFLPRLGAGTQLGDLYRLEQQVAPVLIRAEQHGTALNPAAVDLLGHEWQGVEKGLRGQLETQGIADDALEGAGSEELLREALLKQGVPLTEETPTGELATNKFALQPFEDDHPVIHDLFAWRRARRFLSTYIGPMEGRDLVHPSFMQAEAWTGRMSCRRPNMQNLPKRADDGTVDAKLRSMFVPRPGHSFVVADYEGIEVRLLAHYLGPAGQAYRDLVASDEHDPHAYMATQIWGHDQEYYAKSGPHAVERGQAKNGMFAITYGAGGKRLTDMFKLDPAPWLDEESEAVRQARAQGRRWPKAGWQHREGRALASRIKTALPGYYRLMDRIKSKIKEEGHVTTLRGRKQIVDKQKGYVGLNALIQGSAADIMKQGLVNTAEAIEPLGGRPLLVVHDEIVVEVPTEHAVEASLATVTAMEQAAELAVPLAVDAHVAHGNYGEA